MFVDPFKYSILKYDIYHNRGVTHERKPSHESKVAGPLRPLDTEFVVNSYDELRYVLWQRKITILFYVGGVVNVCMLHRETGLYRVRGTGSEYIPFTTVVFRDCVKAIPTPDFMKKQ